MRHISFIFVLFFLILSAWGGLAWSGYSSFGRLNPIGEQGASLLPSAPSGKAHQGEAVYQSASCYVCHSQAVSKADAKNGLARRASVPRDYIFRERIFLGKLRLGPDLADVGSRIKDRNTYHLWLYAPRASRKDTYMPAYSHFYEVRKINKTPSFTALRFPDNFPKKYLPKAGYEIIPTLQAEQLVAYLMSLKLDYELPEAPFLDTSKEADHE